VKNAYPIADTSEFHCWLSEQTGLTIRTNYADKEKPVTYIGDMENGIDLTAGGWLVIDGDKILVMDEDMVREACIEYYDKYIASGEAVCEELPTIE